MSKKTLNKAKKGDDETDELELEKDELEDESEKSDKPEKKSRKDVPLEYLGGKLIAGITQRQINGKKFNNVIFADGTGKLLNDQDLAAQLKDKPGDLVH